MTPAPMVPAMPEAEDVPVDLEPQRPERRTVPLAEQLARQIEPVSWGAFWSDDAPEPDAWLAEPLLPRGRLTVLYSPAKVGKSLLALDVAAALATGRELLGQPAAPPVRVAYIDAEMTEADLRERLVDLGYGPDDDLSRLVYFQLPSLPALDTERGGQVVAALADMHGAELVVLDTMARVVEGDENESDTYRDFYRYTGQRLKAAGVSLLRLDHAGKDPGRGQRGSSAKNDDADLVWRLSLVEDSVVLTRTHSRVSWVPAQVTLRRDLDPVLRHVLTDGAWPMGTAAVADVLDELEVPLDASVTAAMRALSGAGRGRRKAIVMSALKWRRVRS